MNCRSLRWPIRRFAVKSEKPESMAYRTVTKAIAANVVVCGAKIAATIATGSSAMASEAIHTGVDVANQLLLLRGLQMSKREPDAVHPFGYGKAAFFFTTLSAMGIFWAGGALSLWHGYEYIVNPPAVAIHYGPLTWGTLGLSFALDGAVLVGVLKELKENHVPKGGSLWKTVRDLRDPNVTAVLLEDSAATAGVLLAAGGIALSHWTGNPVWDGVASLAVGGLLGGVAFTLLRTNGAYLLGKAIEPARQARIVEILSAHPSVEAISGLKTRFVGPEQFAISCEIDFDGRALARSLAPHFADSVGIPRQKIEGYSEALCILIESEIASLRALIRDEFPNCQFCELTPASKSLESK